MRAKWVCAVVAVWCFGCTAKVADSTPDLSALPRPWQVLLASPSSVADPVEATPESGPESLPWLPLTLPEAVPAPAVPEPVLAQGPEIELTVPPGTVTRQLAGTDHAALAPRLEGFYAANGFHPLFLDPHRGSAPTNEMMRFLLALHELGLDPFDYHFEAAMALAKSACRIHFGELDEVVASLEARLKAAIPDSPEALVTLDCKADWWPGDEAAVTLDVTLALAWLRLADSLNVAVPVLEFPGAERAVAELVSWLPSSQRYWGRVAALRRFLPHWARGTFPVLGKWGQLKQGDFGPRVARLKRRLVVEGFLAESAANGHWKTFDKATRDAVLAFREAYGLRTKGHVDVVMLKELSKDADAYVQRLWTSLNGTLVAGVEREDTYILVNIPEFRTYYVEAGKVVASYRSVVGFPYEEPGGRTPELSGDAAYVDLNPTWTPTPWVMENELQKKAHREPGYFAANGFVQRAGKWVQKPGPDNTLGQVVIAFPNENNIYLHGTNDPKPFGFADRALSHGCVRVEGIEELALRVVTWSDQVPETPLKRIFDKVVERRIELSRKLPIHLVYDPVTVVDGQVVGLSRDPYKLLPRKLRQARMESLLKVVALAREGRRLAAR
jgi:murein L,D-transpeptidase YcbB/YkuD